jgi:hypothetical protein
MGSSDQKTARRARQAQKGADGLTLGERVRQAMNNYEPPMTESVLLEQCGGIVKDRLSQQLLNQILTNKNSRSAAVPIIAEALGVRAVWLQFGIGPPRDKGPNGRGAMSHQDRADRAFMQAFR